VTATRSSGVHHRRGSSAAQRGVEVGHAVALCALVLTANVAFSREGSQAAPQAAATAAPASPLDTLRFLVGTWQGEGGGRPGQGSGSASFTFDLDGRVLLRHNRSEYPATGDKPAVIHDDLMVIYPVPGTRKLEAMYFDNEGHVIEYAVAASPDGRRVVLSSEPEPSSPTFRLTYAVVDGNTVDVTFEIAPPGHPDAFKPYVSGRMHRAARE